MKTILLLSLVFASALARVKRDAPYSQVPLSPPNGGYEPPSYDAPQQYSLTPMDQVQWNVQSYDNSPSENVFDKGLALFSDLIPKALCIIVIIVILKFLGIIHLPFLAKLSAWNPKEVGRALAEVDVDQVAQTVRLAIDKYNKLFGQ